MLRQNQYILGGKKNLADLHLTIINKVFGGNVKEFGAAQGDYIGTTGMINEMVNA